MVILIIIIILIIFVMLMLFVRGAEDISRGTDEKDEEQMKALGQMQDRK